MVRVRVRTGVRVRVMVAAPRCQARGSPTPNPTPHRDARGVVAVGALARVEGGVATLLVRLEDDLVRVGMRGRVRVRG